MIKNSGNIVIKTMENKDGGHIVFNKVEDNMDVDGENIEGNL